MLIIRNLYLIRVQSWTYVTLHTKTCLMKHGNWVKPGFKGFPKGFKLPKPGVQGVSKEFPKGFQSVSKGFQTIETGFLKGFQWVYN